MTRHAPSGQSHQWQFPFISLSRALLLARIGSASFFAIHAIVRIGNGSMPRFAAFLESVGFPDGVIAVWTITLAELTAAAMVMLGIRVRIATIVLLAIAIGGIVLIHRHFGWFVGEHGTGGSEFSVALILLLLVVAAADREIVSAPVPPGRGKDSAEREGPGSTFAEASADERFTSS